MKSVQLKENPFPPEVTEFNASFDKNIARLLRLLGIVVPVATKHFEEAVVLDRLAVS